MNFAGLLRKRRNVYGFLKMPVPEEVLRRVIENAIHVPSAGFTQDFGLVVVRDGQMKRKLAEAAYEDEYVKTRRAQPRFITDAPVIIVPCGNKSRFEAKYGKPAEKNARLPWWLIDAGFASLALILSAYDEGLVASFLGAIDDAKVMQALGLPADNSVVPLAVIPLGLEDSQEAAEWHAKGRAEASDRRKRFVEFVHWDRW